MLDISSTRRLMSIIVKPRPSLRALGQVRPILPRPPYPYNGNANRRSLQRDCYYVEPTRDTDVRITMRTEIMNDTAGSDCTSNLGTVEEEPSGVGPEDSSSDSEYTSSYTSTSTSSCDVSDGHVPDIEPDSPHLLRSSRHRKCKSVSEVEEAFLKIKDGGEQSYRTSNTWPRTNRSLSWILASGSDPSDIHQSPPEVQPDASYDDRSGDIWRIKDPIQRFSDPRIWQMSPPDDSGTTDPTQYYTALTSLHDTTREESQVLQAVDRESGALFQRICHSTGGDIQQFEQLRDAFSHDLSYQLVPTHWVSQMNAFPQPPGSPCPQQPSLVLTVPTPMVPQSPLFAPQSPITVPKFFSALNQDSNDTGPTISGPATTAPLPTLPSCGECGLVEFEMGRQCRACNQRWLACKVWYRAQDGGRRRWLTEPYIRPAESNARNRALMHGLGLPGCVPSDLDPPRSLEPERPSKTGRPLKAGRNGRQLRRSWRRSNSERVPAEAAPADDPLTATGKSKSSAGVKAIRPLRVIVEFSKTLAVLGLGFLWVAFVKSWAYTVPAPYFPHEHAAAAAAGGVETSENTQAAVSHDELHDWATQYLAFGSGGASVSLSQAQGTTMPPPQRLQDGRAHSKFVEHLIDVSATTRAA